MPSGSGDPPPRQTPPTLMRITAFAVLLLSLVALATLAIPGTASAQPGLAPGKPVAAGAWGYLYGQGSTAFSQQYFSDGDLVYDTSLQVYLLNGQPYSIPIEITSEQFVWGSETVYENITRGNSTVLEPVTVPVRMDVQWANVSVTMLASTLTSAILPLPATSSQKDLVVTIGEASWQLTHLTPATSSLSDLLTTGSAYFALAIESLLSVLVVVVLLFVAKALVNRIRGVPRWPLWWPLLVLGAPTFAFIGWYVRVNQLLGVISPLLYPLAIGLAFFPYLPRLWDQSVRSVAIGFEPTGVESGRFPYFAMPIVDEPGGPRLAPETVREAWWALWGKPLASIELEMVRIDGQQLAVHPFGMAALRALRSRLGLRIDRIYWYDATRPPRRLFTHLEWWVDESRVVERPVRDSETGATSAVTESVTKRRFRPHVVVGSLAAKFAAREAREIVRFVAGMRGLESNEEDHARTRIRLELLRGYVGRISREEARNRLEAFLRGFQGTFGAKSRERLEREAVAASRGRGGRVGTGEVESRSERRDRTPK
jgi:hypothetical protein